MRARHGGARPDRRTDEQRGDFERNETASLDRFLAWFSRGTVDVQRDPGRPANEVRVMTVHGAKGLEAPVVILADATADPARLGRTPITLDFEIGSSGAVPLLRPKKEERCPPFEEAIATEEKRDLEEHWRLLYVALTRAATGLSSRGSRRSLRRTVPRRVRPIAGTSPWSALWFRSAPNQSRTASGARVSLWFGGNRPGQSQGREETIAPDRHSRVGANRRSARGAAAAAAGAISHRRRRRKRAAAERGDARGGAARHLDSPPVRAASVGRSGKRAAAAHRWLERSAGLAEPTRASEIVEQVCGISADAASPLFGAGLAWRSAARRHAAATAG